MSFISPSDISRTVKIDFHCEKKYEEKIIYINLFKSLQFFKIVYFEKFI